MNSRPADSALQRETEAEAVFYEALSVDREAREAFLQDACAADAELRALVDDYLRNHDGAGSFLQQDALVPGELEAARLRAERTGEKIGAYKLLEQIGEGGFGTVWVAEQEHPIRRRVALKIIKLGMDTRDVVARFEQERQALALMDHPHIARVLDAGATPTGRPFFVMELVKGVKITEYCDQAQLSMKGRLELFVQVCNAVQHAHQKGIIHRDLKPSNILVTLHDGVPVPKVIDFGVAKAIQQQRLTDLTIYTQFEQLIGTPLYMAPEQAELSGLDIDTRSDIYSLGVLLYELLTGRTPFDPEKLMKAGYDEMRRVIREEEPQKPSTFLSTMALSARTSVAQQRSAESARLVSAMRGDLDWIVMKSLEKDRNRRYETANGLARDIERHLENEPVQARPPSVGYKVQRFVRRNRVGVAAGSAIAVTLVAGIIVSVWQTRRAEAAAVQARVEADRANREAGRALAAEEAQKIESLKALTEAEKSRVVAQFLEEMLGGVKPSVAVGRDTTMLREILDKTAGRIADLKGQPLVEAEVRRIVGDAYYAIGDANRASEMHREALRILQSTVGEEHLTVASVLLSLSRTMDKVAAGASIDKALAIRRKLLGPDHPEVALALSAAAFHRRSSGQYKEAEELAIEAITMSRKHFGDRHPHTAGALLALAQAVGWQKRDAESEALHREILSILREQHGDTHPEVANSLLNLAQSLHAQNRLEDSLGAAREARQIALKVFGAGHPSYPQMVEHLAKVLTEQKKFVELEELAREELKLHEGHQEQHRLPALLTQLKIAIEGQGKSLNGDPWFRGRVAEAVAEFDRERPDALAQLHSIAHLWAASGEYEKADALFAEELTLPRKDSIEAVGALWENQICRARVLESLGDYHRAEPTRRAIVEEFKKLVPDAHAYLEARMVELAECLYRQNKFEDAELVYKEVLASRTARYPQDHAEVMSTKSSRARLLTDWVWNDLNARGVGLSRKPRLVNLHQQATEAERTLTEALELRIKGGSKTTWRVADLKSRLGSARAAVAFTDVNASSEVKGERLTAAEALLLESSKELQGYGAVLPRYKSDALWRLVQLYTAWRKPQKAAEWRKRLDAIEFDRVEISHPF